MINDDIYIYRYGVTDGLLEGEDDAVSCFGKLVDSVPDPLKARQSLLKSDTPNT